MVTTEQTLKDFQDAHELLRHHWGVGHYHNVLTGEICTRGAFMSVTGTKGRSLGPEERQVAVERQVAMEAEFTRVTGITHIETWNDHTLLRIAGRSKRARRRYVLRTLERVIWAIRARLIAETRIRVEADRVHPPTTFAPESEVVAAITSEVLVPKDAHNYSMME